MSSGFLGVIALGVLGMTRSLPAALVTHALLLLAFAVFTLWRSQGIGNWLQMRIDTVYSVHPSIIVLIGMVFVLAGAWIAIMVEPGFAPDSMTKVDQIYFGAVLGSMGGGLVPMAAGDWLANNRNSRTRRQS